MARKHQTIYEIVGTDLGQHVGHYGTLSRALKAADQICWRMFPDRDGESLHYRIFKSSYGYHYVNWLLTIRSIKLDQEDRIQYAINRLTVLNNDDTIKK